MSLLRGLLYRRSAKSSTRRFCTMVIFLKGQHGACQPDYAAERLEARRPLKGRST